MMLICINVKKESKCHYVFFKTMYDLNYFKVIRHGHSRFHYSGIF